MPIDTDAYTVGTTAVQITDTDNLRQDVLIHNNGTGENIIYIGGSDEVTSTTGTILVAEERISLEIQPGDKVFAIGSEAGINVRVLRVVR